MSKNKELIKGSLIDKRKAKAKTSVDFISQEVVKRVNDFHKGFSEYSVTPLHKLEALANTSV